MHAACTRFDVAGADNNRIICLYKLLFISVMLTRWNALQNKRP